MLHCAEYPVKGNTGQQQRLCSIVGLLGLTTGGGGGGEEGGGEGEEMLLSTGEGVTLSGVVEGMG